LVLGLPLGVGALVAAYGLWARPAWRWTDPLIGWTREHWSWVAAAAVACGVVALVALEVLLTPIRSPLQPVFGAVGVLMAATVALPSVRRHYARR
jgi:acetamidase/formamidase